MKLKTVHLADWVQHSAFEGGLRREPLTTGPGGNVESLDVDSSGLLTARRRDRAGTVQTWLFPPGCWHGEPVPTK